MYHSYMNEIGPGALSLDALLGLSVSGGFWGAMAFLVGLVGGAIQLAQRQPAPSLQTAADSHS